MRFAYILTLTVLPTVVAAAEKPTLPIEWHGEWKGELVVFARDGKTTKVPMTLLIQPRNQEEGLSWKATYQGEKPVTKDYKLQPGEKANRFRIDEGGGIILEARLDGTVLLSTFMVGELTLTARYELVGGALRHEVTSAKKIGDKLPGNIQNFEVISVQRAELKKSR